MKLNITTNHVIRGLVYFLGIIMTGLGVNVLLRSALGAGAWDTVIFNLRALFKNNFNIDVTLGTVSFMIYLIVLSYVMWYYKKLKFLFVFIPMFGIALAIDFWDIIVLSNFHPEDLWIRAILFGVGVFVLALGLSSILVTKYPAMVFDELTLILMKVLHIKSFFLSRMYIELFAIVLATLFGFISNIGFGAVNFGSFLLALIIGPLIQFQLKYLTKITTPLFN
ncbi:YczE/YyaS/YitT family protein [Paracholeplasma manati]|uniref:Integral membrane protein n=1 Tax=Paracholeplasma manati TaxID=591373 RepID=A0ABT2Y4C2_9MOLU|nr:hypothetical protein [Paracholeplasma manati]MCV2231347.1 hypothetical protein [Paracholeplasma manati]MDG0888427.1 hypothetical protein [Paracholeplasma manati]